MLFIRDFIIDIMVFLSKVLKISCYKQECDDGDICLTQSYDLQKLLKLKY